MQQNSVTFPSYSSVFKKAWEIYTTHFAIILKIVCIVYIPINVLLYAFDTYLVPLSSPEDTFDTLRASLRVYELMEFLIGIFATLALISLTNVAFHKKTIPSAEDLLKQARTMWNKAVTLNFSKGVRLFVLYLALLVPGLIWTVHWMFHNEALVVENKEGKEALDYSKAMIKGVWWQSFWFSVVFGITSIFTVMLISIPTWFMPESYALLHLANYLVIDIAFAYFTILNAVLFLELQKRRSELV